jgi:hypothetical protein
MPPAGVDKNADFIFCPAENIASLDALVFDLAVNIGSMQEMNEQTVRNYFDFFRRHMAKDNLFYCCNRLEKVLAGGEVLKFYSYPWKDKDRHRIDEKCAWQRFFFAAHMEPRGPKIGPWRVPFVNYYDGTLQHRLTTLEIRQ